LRFSSVSPSAPTVLLSIRKPIAGEFGSNGQ
jgi:hypothetical protein